MFRKIIHLFMFLIIVSPLAAALDYDQLPNPLKDIRVGQWVSYPVSWEESEGLEKQTITKIEGEGDARMVTVVKEVTVGDEVVQSDEFTELYSDLIEELHSMYAEAEGGTVSPAKLEVNGKEIECVLLAYSEDGIECKIYLSEAIPVTGIARFEVEGLDKPVMAVKDFEK